MSPRVAALLAAGAGSRFFADSHKLLATLHGQPVWHHALRAVAAAGFDRVVVITGAVELHLPSDLALEHVELRHNSKWHVGQATSLQTVVAAALEWDADTVTVGLADQPFVTTDAWRAVADAPAECRLVAATYDGILGPNPVRLHRSVWPLLPTDGDEGARSLLHQHPEWLCRVPCLGSVADIDTQEDLDRWKSC
jgi:CTP:molybdopterin cytidylyltransferase MocA